VRDLLGSVSFFGLKLHSGDGILVFILAPGAFLVLGYLMVLFNKIKQA
jgi:electron transport complex protein RnfE